jgi:[acyl-carrier-protein] S-malonyltransferase
MAVAESGLRDALDDAPMGAPSFPVWSNVTAGAIDDAGEGRAQLVRQLTSPVRWTEEVRAMAAAHPGALFVEMGPGNVLGGLVKRIVPDAKTLACGTARDVEQLLQHVG